MNDNIKKAKLIISKARSSLLIKEPFFGLMALRLQLIPTADPAIPVMGVSSTALYFNCDVVVTLPKETVKFIVAHEVMHIVLGHHWRMKNEDIYPDRKKVNIAQDYAINPLLVDAGFILPLPPWEALIYNKFYNNSAEEIYKQLPDISEDEKIQSNLGIINSKELTKEEIEKEKVLVKQMVTEAKDAAKMQGKLPGNLETFLETVTKVEVDWKKELTTYFFERIREGYSWSKPNRRFIHKGLYLPSHLEVPTGDVLICIDTSGSLNDKQLADFISEINGILEFVKPKKIIVAQCDRRIRDVSEYTIHDLPLEIIAKGRGGTAFEPIFDLIKEGTLATPEIMVYFTDLEANFPEQPKDFQVIWIAHNTTEKAPWGITINIGNAA